MIERRPERARGEFFLDSDGPSRSTSIGDGLLPPDVDGKTKPKKDAPAPIVGTQDDDVPVRRDVRRAQHLGARREVERDTGRRRSARRRSCRSPRSTRSSRARRRPRLPAAAGDHQPDQFLDILSYRQRPTWRLAYRNFEDYETMVTNQSVEALPASPGMRWYEIRRDERRRTPLPAGHVRAGRRRPSLDGLDRAGQERQHGARLQRRQRHDVFPGIRYTGRLAGDPLGQMTQGEGMSSTAPACRRRRTRAGATTRR